MPVKSKIAFGFLLVTAAACICYWFFSSKTEVKTLSELEGHVKSEEAKQTQTVEKKEFRLTVTYRSTAAILLQEYQHLKQEEDRMKSVSVPVRNRESAIAGLRENIKKQQSLYDKSLYFVLKIGYIDGKRDIEYESMKSGYGNYSQWMQRLAYTMNRFIYLETPQVPEVPLVIYQMDRTYGITKDRSFLLVFPRKFNNVDLTKEDWLRVNVREFGLDVGEVSFKYLLPFKETVVSKSMQL